MGVRRPRAGRAPFLRAEHATFSELLFGTISQGHRVFHSVSSSGVSLAVPRAVSSMLPGHGSVLQALLGTFFTWGMTAAGAALVFVFSSGQRRILDGSLGFAAGVMLAASYWSLLAPAVEMATSSGGFGAFAFFPVAVGFTLGAAFVYLADLAMPHLGAAEDPQTALALNLDPALMKKSDAEGPRLLLPETELSIRIGRAGLLADKSENGEAYQRKRAAAADLPEDPAAPLPSRGGLTVPGGSSWRRIALLILAITIHNIPDSEQDDTSMYFWVFSALCWFVSLFGVMTASRAAHLARTCHDLTSTTSIAFASHRVGMEIHSEVMHSA
ncbi:zinc transporter ZIP11 isoform X6 [Rousettus aegyptiacus]|uniref:zinc transporter ZIP11 isoform X6 n=1 Tax=Rousettus aegyptiacus TaxID=9407 RepID=UPI00168CC3A6|nr:zinc transporter ZIP11 isoform X6 [Rousettus aegyptiacus]